MSTESNTELLPCPFCSVVPKPDGDWSYITHAKGCGFRVMLNGSDHRIWPDQIAAWNTRAVTPADTEQLVSLRIETQDGAGLIARERLRQIEGEGYTPEHDDEHTDQSLAKAAVCYATPNRTAAQAVERWPWANAPIVHHNIHNPRGRESRIRELAKAGALIAAEIDRLLRNALGTQREEVSHVE